MARKFVLVSESRFKELQTPATIETSPAGGATIIEEKTENYDTIIELMPKQLRHRSRVLLHYIRPNINPEGRIIYPDETIGSHAYTLLKYYLTDLPTKQKRPVDAKKFEELLAKAPDLIRPKKSSYSWRTDFE